MDDGDRMSFVSRLIPDIRYSAGGPTGMDIKITSKLFPNSSSSNSVTSSVTDTTEEKRVRIRGRQVAFRFESSASGVGWTLGDTRIDIQPDGRR